MLPEIGRSIEDAARAIEAGEVVIVLDGQREREGDFFVAAEKASPASIHLMLSEGRGQLCVPVAADIAARLSLTPMTPRTDDDAANFTVPIDHRLAGTGVSPLDRHRTIQAIVDGSSRPEDFTRPGHIFPLIAHEGGILERAGHTEAAIELAAIAGLQPAGVLCEICSSDGLHMADEDELLRKADELGLCVVSIAEIVAYRQGELSEPSSRGRDTEQLVCTAQAARQPVAE